VIRSWLIALLASILSGAYWLLFFLFAESFTAADFAEGAGPADRVLRFKVAAVLIGGPLLFALLIQAWRRLARATSGKQD
jgi:hypothetical protein